jgi:hypothetical protein
MQQDDGPSHRGIEMQHGWSLGAAVGELLGWDDVTSDPRLLDEEIH